MEIDAWILDTSRNGVLVEEVHFMWGLAGLLRAIDFGRDLWDVTLGPGFNQQFNYIDMKKRRKVMHETLFHLSLTKVLHGKIGEYDLDVAFGIAAKGLAPNTPSDALLALAASLKRRMLRSDVDGVQTLSYRAYYGILAQLNLHKWHAGAESHGRLVVEVLASDWGEATYALTSKYGAAFVVLNMANAELGGGGYVEGHPAQEENIFRRSDCHFHLDKNTMLKTKDIHDKDSPRTQAKEKKYYRDLYVKNFSKLLEACYVKDPAVSPQDYPQCLLIEGQVFLDHVYPRYCFRGPERRAAPHFGYDLLPDEEVFPFYEMRAAAVDHRDGRHFSSKECTRRVRAQFETLKSRGKKHVVFGAFGCGAFLAPAREVAKIYADMVHEYRDHLEVVAFAIFYQGYGMDNYTPFQDVFGETGDWCVKPEHKSGQKVRYYQEEDNSWSRYGDECNNNLEICAAQVETQTGDVNPTVFVSDEETVDVREMMQKRVDGAGSAIPVRRFDEDAQKVMNDMGSPVTYFDRDAAAAAGLSASTSLEKTGRRPFFAASAASSGRL